MQKFVFTFPGAHGPEARSFDDARRLLAFAAGFTGRRCTSSGDRLSELVLVEYDSDAGSFWVRAA